MNWLLVTIFAYLILAVVFLVDKHLLVGPIPNPKVYAFYTGVLGIAVVLLIPFINFHLPDRLETLLSFISGASFIFGIFWFFKALKLFESSRVVPAVGGILPIFTFLLIYIFSKGKENLSLSGFSAFILLVAGSFLITYQKTKKISWKSLQISVISAFFLAVSFVSAKYVYISSPFLVGLVWIRIGGGVSALILLLSSALRREVFKEKIAVQKKTALIFLSNQAAGAGGNILQNWAVALAPFSYVAFINALQGVQYLFLLIFAVFLSLKFPEILKEEISKEILLQKIIAILLIGGGLVLLAK
ncbi:MAG: hypothetical protein COX92_00515 [Candidatus Nealsonbacteria bacterium CG_4_10_14_0_2_um_filter_40_15]|uniref:EamA domain-containing protein n=1 Tax=Candidatus Nealsonbacteria bacterium CG_4_10_14_0_2_um_filter_40_15 TaxID=1974682 RepID=A0A2M7UV08_9BACT|nr:MAG: hypothetical protein COX92_00515 [Candidatus Nealsonbacteria bacterium CG_4_10_14_0_2_um_filter_40_15]